MSDTVATHTGYHAIGARNPGVSVTAATDDALAGYHSCNSHIWSRPVREYSSWSRGGCLAVLGAMQLVKLRIEVMTWIILFRSDHRYYPHFVKISTFRGYYPHFMDISVFCGYYPHFVDIPMFHGYYPNFVGISLFHGYYPYFVDIIRISHIISYLDRNGCHVLHIFFLVVDIICIGHIMSYLVHNVRPIFHI